MSRVLVTGVDGFTGRHLARLLSGRGHDVHGVIKASSAAAIDGVSQVHVVDLLQAAAVANVLVEVQPQAVVHLAAISFVAHGDVDQIYCTNIVGTRNLLAGLADPVVKQGLHTVLLASSANVYGNSARELIDESVQPAPSNDYAVSKLAMEFMARTWMERLPITLVRPFNYCGVGQSASFLVPKIVAHFASRAPVIELGNTEVERDFSDVRRVVDAYARLLDAPQPGRVFNICSGEGHSLNAILALASELTGHALAVRVNPALVRINEVRRLVGDASAIERAIGPLRSFTLRETLSWMLQGSAEPGI